jgi:DNA-binding NtrC family response regulator
MELLLSVIRGLYTAPGHGSQPNYHSPFPAAMVQSSANPANQAENRMENNILLVQNETEPVALNGDNLDEWRITRAATGEEALALLEEPIEWQIIVSGPRLPDMQGLVFLKKALLLSDAVQVLLTPDTGLAAAVHQANSMSIFRVIPQSTPAGTLKIILRDACAQYRMRRQEALMLQRIEALTIVDPLTEGLLNS